MTETRRFGDYQVSLLIDGRFEASPDLIIHIEGVAARNRALARRGSSSLRIDVNCFHLRRSDSMGLVDAGAGSAWGSDFGHARTQLAAMGVGPADIDWVLLTHLHPDHVLGLLDGGAAYLPRASILVPQTDLAYFGEPANADGLAADKRQAFEITRILQAAYGARLQTIEAHGLPPAIEAIPLPGHSPGHTGVSGSRRQTAAPAFGRYAAPRRPPAGGSEYRAAVRR